MLIGGFLGKKKNIFSLKMTQLSEQMNKQNSHLKGKYFFIHNGNHIKSTAGLQTQLHISLWYWETP